jgi:hypothetical protein
MDIPAMGNVCVGNFFFEISLPPTSDKNSCDPSTTERPLLALPGPCVPPPGYFDMPWLDLRVEDQLQLPAGPPHHWPRQHDADRRILREHPKERSFYLLGRLLI